MRASLVIPVAVIPLLCLGGCVDVHNPPSETAPAAIVTPAPTYTAPTTTYVSPGSTTTVGPGGMTTVHPGY